MGKKNESICRVIPADLNPVQIDAVRQMESTLDRGICLLAVKLQPLFLVEAKTAPNQWQAIESVYRQNGLPSWYGNREAAVAAKAVLKGFLHGKWKHRYKKFPIRVREVRASSADHEE